MKSKSGDKIADFQQKVKAAQQSSEDSKNSQLQRAVIASHHLI